MSSSEILRSLTALSIRIGPPIGEPNVGERQFIRESICEGSSGYKYSTKVVTVIDHTKFNKSSFIKTMDTENTDVLITDFPLHRSWTDFLSEKKIEYRVAIEVFPEYGFLYQTKE